MKSKKIRRLVSIVLVLLLATQFVFAASAASETWYDSAGSAWVAHVTRTGSSSKVDMVYNHEAAIWHEMSLGDSYFVSGYYDVTYTEEFRFISYAEKLTAAAAKTNMYETYEDNIYMSSNGAFISDDSMTGSYYPLSTFYGYTGTYYVAVARDSGPDVVVEGSISFAPYNCTGVVTGYVWD